METPKAVLIIAVLFAALFALVYFAVFMPMFNELEADWTIDLKNGTQSMGPLKIISWTCEAGPGATDTLKITFTNTLDSQVTNLSILASHEGGKPFVMADGTCMSQDVLSGASVDCTFINFDCEADLPDDFAQAMGWLVYDTDKPDKYGSYYGTTVWQVFGKAI